MANQDDKDALDERIKGLDKDLLEFVVNTALRRQDLEPEKIPPKLRQVIDDAFGDVVETHSEKVKAGLTDATELLDNAIEAINSNCGSISSANEVLEGKIGLLENANSSLGKTLSDLDEALAKIPKSPVEVITTTKDEGGSGPVVDEQAEANTKTSDSSTNQNDQTNEQLDGEDEDNTNSDSSGGSSTEGDENSETNRGGQKWSWEKMTPKDWLILLGGIVAIAAFLGYSAMVGVTENQEADSSDVVEAAPPVASGTEASDQSCTLTDTSGAPIVTLQKDIRVFTSETENTAILKRWTAEDLQGEALETLLADEPEIDELLKAETPLIVKNCTDAEAGSN